MPLAAPGDGGPSVIAPPTTTPPSTTPTPPAPTQPTIQDYMNLILSDPIYQKTLNDEHTASVADAAQLGQGIVNALVQRGVVPDIDSIGAKLGLSPAVINWIKSNVDLTGASALAAQNNAAGTSTEAQLERAHAVSLGNIKDTLAARGLIRSGATAFDTGQEEQNYTNNQYQANKAIQDYISGAYNAFMGNESGRSTDANNALSDAYQRALQLYPNGIPATVAPTPAPAPPASSVGPGVKAVIGANGGNFGGTAHRPGPINPIQF